jgi:FMN phosphatase YigB (HAD superfamily)
MRTIIVDLDGTLADVGHRLHHLQGRKSWKRFFEGMPRDPVNVWCRTLMTAMKREGYGIAIITGRPDEYETAIRTWLLNHDVPYDRLHMRKSGDFRADDIVKKEILDAHFRKEDILFVVDDRQTVVDMWRREGLVCLQCAPHAA